MGELTCAPTRAVVGVRTPGTKRSIESATAGPLHSPRITQGVDGAPFDACIGHSGAVATCASGELCIGHTPDSHSVAASTVRSCAGQHDAGANADSAATWHASQAMTSRRM